MKAIITLVGIFGIVGLILCLSLMFWEKNQIISIVLLLVGVILAIYVIISETMFKKRRHDAPWLFDEYKGE